MEGRKRPRVDSSQSNGGISAEGEKFYFDSYGQLGIHEAMLRDTVRTEAYYDAINSHRHLFQDKVVIDVGCGTGILSLFSAWAGAKRVYAIEASGMADHAERVIAHNNESHIITVVRGKVEDIDLVDELGQPVVADIIVSEWMGYFLFYESMLESVLLARDRWLNKNGAMFPSHAVLYLCPVTDDQYYGDRVFFWRNVYGADMSCLFDHARSCSFDNVIVDTVHPFQCFAVPSVIKFLDCKTCSIEEVQTWNARMNFRSMIVTNFHGFVGYFTVLFAPEPCPGEGDASLATGESSQDGTKAPQHDGISTPLSAHSQRLLERLRRHDPTLQHLSSLTTSPEHPTTHWQHTFFFTGDQLLVVQDQEIEAQIDVSQNKENKRFLDIIIHWTIKPPPAGAPTQYPIGTRAPQAISPNPLLRGPSSKPRPRYINPYAVPAGQPRPPRPMQRPRGGPQAGYAVDNGYGGYGHGFGYDPYACGGYPPNDPNNPYFQGAAFPAFPEPDTENQHLAENPSQNPEFEHSKTFGFK